MKISFKVDRLNCFIGGPIYKEEILLFAVLVYASKGDLSKSVGVSYDDLRRFEKYKLSVSLPEFHEVCLGLSRRRGWCDDRLGKIGMPWFESYQKRGWWGIFKFSHVLDGNVHKGNYMELVENLLRCIN